MKNFLTIGLSATLFFVLVSTAQGDTATNLSGYWTFDEGSGTTANDLSGNANDGVLLNGLVWAQGDDEGALRFDGIDDTVDIPSTLSLEITDAITLSAWANADVLQSSGGKIICKGDCSSSGSADYWLQVYPAGVSFGVLGDSMVSATGDSISTNTWHHLVGTYDGTTLRLYVDGVENASVSYTGLINSDSTRTLHIGNSAGDTDPDRTWSGLIDEVRIYHRALSEEDVQELYNVGGPPPVVYQCSDGIDNDGDGLTDFPSDPGCTGDTDINETDPPPPDTISPSIPVNFIAVAISSSAVALSWDPSTDNVGVSGYHVYRDGVWITSLSGTSFTDSGLVPVTAYAYEVEAYDAAMNESGRSETASAVTRDAGSTTGNAMLQSMQNNTWLKIIPSGTEHPTMDGILAYSGMAYDSIHQKMLLFGGGHGDYWGNEIWAFDMTTLAWQRMYEPDPRPDLLPADAFSTTYLRAVFNPVDEPLIDARPLSRHTYDTVEFITSSEELFTTGQYTWGDGTASWCWGCNDTWTYNLDTNKWTYRNLGGQPVPSGLAGAAYDPVSDLMYVVDMNNIWTYDISADSWTSIGSSPTGSIEMVVEYDSRRRVLYLFGGEWPSQNDLWEFDIASGSWSQLNPLGTPPPAGGGYGLAYDSVNDVLLAMGRSALWIYNIGSNTWAEVNTAVNPPYPINRIHGSFKYDPVNNVAILIENGLDVWAFKYRAESVTVDTTPPTQPVNVSTAAVSSGQVDLFWNSATDNTGVIGYKIYRDGVFIATSGGLSYSDYAVSADTTYSYQVSAYDFAGNESMLSTAVTVVTEVYTDSVVTGGVQLDPPTLHSLGMSLPIISGDSDYNVTVDLFYRRLGENTWKTGLSLLRVRPETIGTEDPPENFGLQSIGEQFAGSIFDLEPQTTYEIQLQINDPDGITTTRTVIAATKSEPKEEPENPVLISVGSVSELQIALSNATSGDIITLANGNYAGPIHITRNGTETDPVIIRGESQIGVIIDAIGATYGVEIDGSHVIVENMTVQGSEWGARIRDTHDVVVRLMHFTDVLKGINASDGTNRNHYICDNVLEGRVVWPDTSKPTWNYEGIKITGQGHDVCRNTLSGFGDSIGLGFQTDIPNRSIDIYNNDVLWGGDDGLELDGGERNIRAYRNRISNTGNGVSFQPVWGGPIYVFRNVLYNLERGPYKINNDPTGIFILHNTSMRSDYAWTQWGGDVANITVNNNIIMGRTVPVDWTTGILHGVIDYNGWMPDGSFHIIGNWSPFTDFQQNSPYENHGVLLTSPVFSGMADTLNDFVTYKEPVQTVLSMGSNAVDRGKILANINDGFIGSGPDLGACEQGGVLPEYGVSTEFLQPLPTATLLATPSTITVGGNGILSWSSTNSISCIGTGFDTGGATAGSVSISPSSNTTYTLTCTGTGGTDTATICIGCRFPWSLFFPAIL